MEDFNNLDEGVVSLLACAPFVCAFIITDGQMTESDKVALREVVDEMQTSDNIVIQLLGGVIAPNHDGLYAMLMPPEESHSSDLNQIYNEAVSDLPDFLKEQYIAGIYELAFKFFSKSFEVDQSPKKMIALGDIRKVFSLSPE